MNSIYNHTAATFLPEWVEQDAILLAWPDASTDWRDNLEEVCGCYKHIIASILEHEDVVLLTHNPEHAQSMFGNAAHRLIVVNIPYDDTWARDFGPIATSQSGTSSLLDFTFNAWGMKFAASNDNMINRRLAAQAMFSVPLLNCKDFVLEGGSVESDGNGCIMTTSSCLLAPNRNDTLAKAQIEVRLKELLGSNKVLWLNHGHLAGDDTDGHIDTLARFAPSNTIIYTACDDADDEHFTELRDMEHEIQQFTNACGKPYHLVRLPLPDPIYDDDGDRLPATYANFLVCNGAVLVPTYGQPQKDALAIARIKDAFPSRNVHGIDCNPLIKQHGSLHCATMQLPKGFLNYENRNNTTE